ncbi:MAG TPA: inositol monophosphatase family protein, partial [Bacteroidales bacterium]|nr:inositol monophosphatase family protein [Bacteroidales bacterium]
MKSFLHDLNEEVISLSKKVGYFIAGEQQNITSADIGLKGLHDYVTHVDKTSEKRLVEGLSKILPGSGFLVEEGTVADAGNEYTWIVDPLDGTTNFIHGLPVFSISIALQQNGLTIMGLVYDIKAGECFYAIKGAGAHLNGKQISVSVIPGLSEALLATGFPYND